MSAKRKPRDDLSDNTRVHNDIGTCPTCLKRIWRTRKAARRALRATHPGAGMSPYPCPDGHGFHYGHLSARVKSGDTDRRDLRKDNTP